MMSEHLEYVSQRTPRSSLWNPMVTLRPQKSCQEPLVAPGATLSQEQGQGLTSLWEPLVVPVAARSCCRIPVNLDLRVSKEWKWHRSFRT